MPRGGKYVSKVTDLSLGLVSTVSDYDRHPKYAKYVNNAFMRPYRAMRVRGGSQRLSSGLLTDQPHSLGEWLAASGANKLFVGCKSGASTGTLYEVGASSFTAQTPAFSLSETILTFCQLNDTLWCAQYGGANVPMLFRASNPANTWLSMALPSPGNTLTLTPGAGGALTAGATYYYRLRWRHTDGSSTASTPQSTGAMGVNNRVTVTTIPGGARADYLGWTLERTKADGSSAGPFYLVADGSGAGPYVDDAADAGLFERTDETLHAAPLHMDGLVAFKDRLFGWAGSTLYASQSIGDDEATGLCNWDALNAYYFGKDDGDIIQRCDVQQDRLIVMKKNSVWALEGDDPDSFRVVPLYSGAGASGPRAAVASGGRAWFYGGGGNSAEAADVNVLVGNSIRPTGTIEIGYYTEQFAAGLISDVEAVQYLGQYVLICYSRAGVMNDEVLVYDQRYDNWSHFTGWRMRGAIVQRGTQFSSATLMWGDPKNWPRFTNAGITAGMTVTGAGIPALTTVVSVSADGTSIVISAAATATAGPVTLTFAGTIAINSCFTTNLSTTVTSKDYRLWQGFRGWLDEKEADGTGGVPVEWYVEFPFIDDGAPDVFKEFTRLQVFALSDNQNVGASISFDPPCPGANITFAVENSGAVWGSFLWGAAAWADAVEGGVHSGLPESCIARRYRLRLTCRATGDLVFKGFAVDATLRPERRYS